MKLIHTILSDMTLPILTNAKTPFHMLKWKADRRKK